MKNNSEMKRIVWNYIDDSLFILHFSNDKNK